MNYKPKFIHAIAELAPNVSYTYDPETEEILTWDDPVEGKPDGFGITQPTKAEIDAELKRQQDQYDALNYSRKRKEEYPDLAEQFDLLFHDMTSGKGDKTGEWYKAVNKVKTDNPKG